MDSKSRVDNEIVVDTIHGNNLKEKEMQLINNQLLLLDLLTSYRSLFNTLEGIIKIMSQAKKEEDDFTDKSNNDQNIERSSNDLYFYIINSDQCRILKIINDLLLSHKHMQRSCTKSENSCLHISFKYKDDYLFLSINSSDNEIGLVYIEQDILQNLVLFDFNSALDSIDYHKKLGLLYTLIHSLIIKEMKQSLKEAFNEHELIEDIANINNQIKHDLCTIERKFYVNLISLKEFKSRLILQFTFEKTQSQFFSEINTERNLLALVKAFDYYLDGRFCIQRRIKSGEFAKMRVMKKICLTKRFIIQVTEYSALSNVLYCIKIKNI